MNNLSQENAPILEALEQYKLNRVLPFDVPGHKRGKGNKELTNFLGEKCLTVDVNSMKPLDNLCHPVSVIKDAENLAAEAFHAKNAFFMINGTTSAVQAMVMTVCKAGEKIIMPRNVHRSAINALILCGAIPVYVNPGTNKEIGIPLGMSVEDVKEAILENSDAKAVLVNNPTYYGICSNLKEITKLAHKFGMKVIVDEAHGTHFYFSDKLPISAMDAGADMAAVSMHKTGGSLTQSSLLLINNDIDRGYVNQIINLTQTTSASYLLLSSLDISRRNLAIHGSEIVNNIINLAQYARDEVNKIDGYYGYSKELIDDKYICDFDVTKLSICTLGIGLAGIEVYSILRDEYEIQVEFGDLGNILAIISVGDKKLAIERLVAALCDIEKVYGKNGVKMFDNEYINPKVAMAPKDAFYSNKISLPIEESEGKISTEFVMCYPPGIPILAPGEMITNDILEYIKYAKEKGCQLTGTKDEKIEFISVVED